MYVHTYVVQLDKIRSVSTLPLQQWCVRTHVCMHVQCSAGGVGYASHSQMHFDLSAGQNEHAREGRGGDKSEDTSHIRTVGAVRTYMHTHK